MVERFDRSIDPAPRALVVILAPRHPWFVELITLTEAPVGVVVCPTKLPPETRYIISTKLKLKIRNSNLKKMKRNLRGDMETKMVLKGHCACVCERSNTGLYVGSR